MTSVKNSFSIFLFLIFAYNITFAQLNRANYKILGISVEGNKTADPTTIIANSGLKEGSEIEIPGDATNNAIKRLWTLGIFNDIQIIIDKKIENGVFLLIKVEELKRVEEIQVSGNDQLDEDDIIKEIPIVKGQTLKPQDIKRAEIKIKKLYEDEGYLNAKIKSELYSFFNADTSDDVITVTWRNDNDMSQERTSKYEFSPDIKSNIIRKIKDRKLLLFKIEEGDEVIVNTIEFVGNKAYDDDDLKSEFDETKEDRWWRFWSSANFKQEDFKKDEDLLRDFYRKNGYRDFEILGDTLIYNKDKSAVDILISVYEGPQYKIRNIVWEGNSIYDDKTLNARLDFKKGDIYDYERFTQNLYGNQTQNDVAALYMDNGFLRFTQEISEKKVADDSIDVLIRVTENNQFKIDRVEITGNDRTMDKVIRRELYTVPGDYFRRSNVFRSIQQLANLQYFNVEKLYKEGVDFKPAGDSTVNLIYKVEEKSSDYLNASVGYSGAFGFSGSVGVTLSNFYLPKPFVLGGGQRLDFNWQFGVGNFYRTFSIGFTEPWFLDTPTLIGVNAFDTRQRYIYDLRQSGISLKLGRRLTWPDDRFYVQGMFKFQYNDVIDGRNFYNEGVSRQYTLGATISRTDIDNPIFPSTGSKLSLNAELSGGPILPGDVDYYKIQFKTEWYRRLFHSNRLTFFTSLDLGYIHEIVAGTNIQPFEFFFMGGNGLVIATTPLRGYDDRSVGPRNFNGDIIGGRVMAKYTAEIRAAITLEPMPLYILAFAEAGNTFLDLNSANLLNLRRSVGVGARILINPIGLIGFDYGYGFDRRSVDGQDPQWVFHFQFGRGF